MEKGRAEGGKRLFLKQKQKKSAPADPESRSSDSSNQEVTVPSRAEGMEFPSLL